MVLITQMTIMDLSQTLPEWMKLLKMEIAQLVDQPKAKLFVIKYLKSELTQMMIFLLEQMKVRMMIKIQNIIKERKKV